MTLQETGPTNSAGAEWRAHWPLVLASWVGNGFTALPLLSLSALALPLQAEFGWSRAVLALGLSVHAAVGVFGNPIVGWMIDRWGPRRIALPGIVLNGLAFALFATMGGSVGVWLGLWLLYSIAGQLILVQVWSAAVASEFDVSRGPALGVTLTGSGALGAVIPICLVMLADAHGWRSAYAVVGLSSAIGAGLIILLFFRSKQDLVHGASKSGLEKAQVAEGTSARDALRSPVFIKLAITAFLGYLVSIGIMAHMVPMLRAGGLTLKEAALAAGICGAFGVLGKLVCGALAMRVRGDRIMAALLSLPILTCSLLLIPKESLLTACVAIALLGFSAGGQIKMLVFLTTRVFGLKAFGTIFGLIGGVIAVSTGIGPVLAGLSFDITNSYFLQLTACIPLSIFSMLLMLTLGDTKKGDPAAASAPVRLKAGIEPSVS